MLQNEYNGGVLVVPRLPFYYSVATITEFSPVMTMPPVYGGRPGLAFVVLGLSEGHFFLHGFSFSVITPGKEEIQAKEEQQQRFMHSKDLFSEDFLLPRLCDSGLENRKCPILHRSVNQQMPCIPLHERMKRKLSLLFLSPVLL